jgi:hypothetical protein
MIYEIFDSGVDIFPPANKAIPQMCFSKHYFGNAPSAHSGASTLCVFLPQQVGRESEENYA